jgi:hypothetical protein
MKFLRNPMQNAHATCPKTCRLLDQVFAAQVWLLRDNAFQHAGAVPI